MTTAEILAAKVRADVPALADECDQWKALASDLADALRPFTHGSTTRKPAREVLARYEVATGKAGVND